MNIFATGPVGVGKRTTLERRLQEHAHTRPDPSGWVYLHNFADPREPIAVRLNTGEAQRLAADMRDFLEDARGELVAAFESELYAQRRRQATEPVEHEQEAARILSIPDDVTQVGLLPVAYTTVMTMMRILQEKGYLTKVAQEKAHVYRPARPRQQVVGAMLRDFVDRVFDGASDALLLHLARDNKLTPKQKRLLTRLLDEYEEE